MKSGRQVEEHDVASVLILHINVGIYLKVYCVLATVKPDLKIENKI